MEGRETGPQGPPRDRGRAPSPARDAVACEPFCSFEIQKAPEVISSTGLWLTRLAARLDQNRREKIRNLYSSCSVQIVAHRSVGAVMSRMTGGCPGRHRDVTNGLF